MDWSRSSLYLVTDRKLCGSRKLETVVEEAVLGGVGIVQLREKSASTGEFVELAVRLRQLLDIYSVPLIINDRIDVALASGAAGVHLGQSDMPYDAARRILGPGSIIGLSIENRAQLDRANSIEGLDYVAASPVFSTLTKTDIGEPWGLDGLREFCAFSAHPVVAIGGINLTNISEISRCGAVSAAVVSAIICSTSPKKAASELRQEFAKTL